MDKNRFSFYLENNNVMFNGDVLVVCYKATNDEIKNYGLTSPYVVVFIKNNEFSKIKHGIDCDYFSKVENVFKNKKIILRIQSECLLGMYGDSHCDCETQRINSIKIISENDGIYIHMPQEAQGWGLFYKLKELELQVSGRLQNGEYVGKKDRDSAQKLLLGVHDFSDNRSYSIVYKILKSLSLEKNIFSVITDSNKKIDDLKSFGMTVVKYSEDIISKINVDNISEYLIKIYNSTHDYNDEIIDAIVKIISDGKYNERTLLTFISIIDRIKSDNTYQLDEKIKIRFLNLYESIICGDEKRYILGDEKHVKIQNNFSCKVDSTIFKSLCSIYGKNIFDRITLEKIYYFKNINDGSSIRVRTSRILDNIENICSMFNGQMYLIQSTYDEHRKKVIQKEISTSSLRSYFENPDYVYQKRVEMVTTISEKIIPGLNVYIKRIPNIENRVMDVFGNKEDIKRLIDSITKLNSKTLLNIINDKELSEQNFSNYNLRFADLDGVIEEEINMYELTKESEKNGIRSKILLPNRGIE